MKLYVPNTQLWTDYFEQKVKGTSNQRGGGRRPRIICIKPPKSKSEQHISIKAVLPTEQTTAQAKSELEREDINPKEVERAFQNLADRRGKGTKRPAQGARSSKAKRSRKEKKSSNKKPSRKSHPDIFEIK